MFFGKTDYVSYTMEYGFTEKALPHPVSKE